MNTQTEIILNRICLTAAEQRVSEVYLLPAQTPFIRIDGKMKSMVGEGIVSLTFINELFDNFFTPEEREEIQKNRQLETMKSIGKIGNCQVNVYYQKNQLALRIKLLAQEIVSLDKLGVPAMAVKFAELNRGLVFITGPRDSGRSTLANSLLSHINKSQCKFIATVEKPIKSVISGLKSVVEQREVGKDVHSFMAGLNFVRQRNADVVLISQINNAEIMDEIFAITEAGSLVFAIMDTESSIKTIKRILHFYPSSKEESIRYFLSENLGGIISSRLVPAIGGGRLRALEILTGTSAVRNIIASGRFHQLSGLLYASEDQTSISLDQYLADLVASSKIMIDEALSHCINEEIFRSLLRR